VVTLSAPPLREHRDDIPVLIGHFLEKHRTQDHSLTTISQETLDILMTYYFPGNARELENIVQRALALARGSVFSPDLLPDEVRNAPREKPLKTLEEVERLHIEKVLRATGGNKTQAALILGIDRVSLWRKLKRHSME